MARSFQVDAALLAMSLSSIAESRRLLATSLSERGHSSESDLLASSRAKISESRRLLAELELSPSSPHRELRLVPTASVAPEAAQIDGDPGRGPAALSVHIFQEGARFGWTVCGPGDVMLGSGTAESELKARVDAFHAGMIYLDWTKDRRAADDTSLH